MIAGPDPLRAVGEVAWHELYHAYGPATDVPDQLRALRDGDPERRAWARGELLGNVYHQGTRWSASAATVPLLAALVDDPATPERDQVLRLLTALAIGDLRDDRLPFDPARAFAAGDAIGAAELERVVGWLYGADDPPEPDEEMVLLGDAAAVRWAADAYRRAAECRDSYARWVHDEQEPVAARAAALLAWFPPTGQAMAALLAVPADRVAVRASANLTLAHLAGADPRTDELLEALLDLDHGLVAVTAAVALAYRRGDQLPDAALSILVDAYGRELPGGVDGWHRAPRGFVALALHRLGLA